MCDCVIHQSTHPIDPLVSIRGNSPFSPIVPLVSTRPGLTETTMKPSSCNLTAHFVAAISAAAFVMPYAAMSAMAAFRTNPGSAPAVLTTTIFFVLPARSRGKNAEML